MKRLLALLMCFCLCLSMIPAAMAEHDIEIIDFDEPDEDLIMIIEPDQDPPTITIEDDKNATGSGTCGDNLTWVLNSSGVLTVSGTGEMTEYGKTSDTPWNSLRDSITAVVVDDGVTSIGSFAFSVCSNLQTASIADSVRSIGEKAFSACSKLNNVSFPDSVVSIGYFAFYSCFALTDVVLPPNLQNYGKGAFASCTHLMSISISKSNPSFVSIDGVLFNKSKTELIQCPGGKAGDFAIPNGVKRIWGDAFYACESLTSITFPNTVTEIGDHAFSTCRNILSLEIPSNVTDFGEGTFYYCYHLLSISLPSELTTIGKSCFSWCYNLSAITIPSKVNSIGEYAFSNCNSLKSVKFLGKAPTIASNCFNEVVSEMYYPSGLWSLSSLQQYGGKLSWTPYVLATPTIKTQPKSFSVKAGTTVKFTVAASGEDLRYQWQFRKSSSGSWSNSSSTGAKTATLKIEATEARNGYQYRCKVTNAAGTATSKAATLTIVTMPTVTTQPKSVTAAAGDTVKFTVKASGGGLSYQWQFRKSSSGTWSNSSSTGAKTATLTIEATEARSGYQYRCKVTNAAGTVTSKAATLTVVTKPAITTQPKSVSTTAGTTVKFTVKATGGGLTYQWQFRKSSSGTWSNSTATGAKTATLTIDATAARNGYQYRCVITNAAGKVTSKAATLTVK